MMTAHPPDPLARDDGPPTCAACGSGLGADDGDYCTACEVEMQRVAHPEDRVTPSCPSPKKPATWIGFPAAAKLEEFGAFVDAAFGEVPHLVGSAITSRDHRDVDVRLILADEDYAARFGRAYARVVMELAFCALGREMTGLPIDFQIQQRTEANKKFPGPRLSIGCLSVARLREGRESDVCP
jgi:hypothetical protein